MAKVAYYNDICRFLNDLKIQDDSTVMYRTAIKLIDLCKVTNFMANIEEDAAKMAQEQGSNEFALSPELNGIGGEEVDLGVQPVVTDMLFKIDEFKHALERNLNEDVYHTLVQSNEQQNGSLKVPPQVLFLDWGDSYAYRYSSSNMQEIGLDVNIVQDNT